MAQVWLQRMIKMYQKYQQLMKGRYAKFDELNRFLLILSLLFSLLSRWLPYGSGRVFSLLFLGILFYRFLSTKIYPRLNENQRFLKNWRTVRNFFQTVTKRKLKTNKKTAYQTYTYFSCPNCQQKQRAPQGRGKKIRVTCKKCGTRFETNV